jgi:hypothetical protein
MATQTNHSLVELTDFFPSTSYRLAYDLPLFALSLLLTFAGAFLTLDRTRSFRPRSDPLHVPGSFNLTKKPKRVRFYLQGGLGGVAIGYSFGRMSMCILCRKLNSLRMFQSICQRFSPSSFPVKLLLRHWVQSPSWLSGC